MEWSPSRILGWTARSGPHTAEVTRHEKKLNDIETYRAVDEKDADHDRDDLKEHTASVSAIKESTKLDTKTWLKIVGIIAVTSVVVSHGSTSVLGVLLRLVTA